MVARWLLGFTLALQVTFAVAEERTDYRQWTPEKQKQVADRWNVQFEGTKKQAAYLQNYASGRMDSMVKQINNEHQVRTMVRDSGIDPDTGRKIKIEATVTQTANKAKVASAITERLKNAKNYAKNVGKASIPTFVGMAAFHGLMEGIGWVIDEGGEVKRLPTQEDPDPTSSPCSSSNENCSYAPTLYWIANYERLGTYSSELSAAKAAWKGGRCAPYSPLVKGGDSAYRSGGDCMIGSVLSKSNPNYLSGTPSPTPDLTATPEQIQTALKNALESNNPALASAIAEAIKSAYTPDGSAGQNPSDQPSNGLATGAADSARDAVNKAASNTGSEPSSEGKPGYYKITDGDKTIEGYVYPSDTTSTGTTDSTTTTNPDGSTTTTGTMAQEWPAFCDWAGIVCEFIDWVKEDEQIQEDEPEEIDDSIFDREFDIEFNMGAACPPNPIWKFDFVGQHWSKEIDITSVCDFFKYLGYAIVFASNITALWIVYAAVTVREQA